MKPPIVKHEQDDQGEIWIVELPDQPGFGALFGSEGEAREHADWLTAIVKLASLLPKGTSIQPTGRDVEEIELVIPGIGTIDLDTFTPEA